MRKIPAVVLLLTAVMLIASCAGSEAARNEKSWDREGPRFLFRILLKEKGCQMAVWLEDETGRFVDTVYVTRKTAVRGLGNRGGGLDDRWGGSRLSVLPVWAHRRGVDYGDGNYYPSREQPLPDAVTSATPKAGWFEWTHQGLYPLQPGVYYFYIEVNESFDSNETENYSWYRGQPSVVWRGRIEVGPRASGGRAELIGHGSPDGSDGLVREDVSRLTTALELIKEGVAEYHPEGGPEGQ